MVSNVYRLGLMLFFNWNLIFDDGRRTFSNLMDERAAFARALVGPEGRGFEAACPKRPKVLIEKTKAATRTNVSARPKSKREQHSSVLGKRRAESFLEREN